MKKYKYACVIIFALTISQSPFADQSQVLVTLRPIHSLVAAVMGMTGTPQLILETVTSPHGYGLTPSQRRMVDDAAILFYVDDQFETFLQRILPEMPAHILKIALAHSDTITTLPYRNSDVWGSHHHDHGQDDSGSIRGTDTFDPHIWLSPMNAIAIVNTVAHVLSEKYPANRKHYQRNASLTVARLMKLDDTLKAMLAPIRYTPFIVFHDAYQYLEQHYDLSSVGSITVEPDRNVSIKRMRNIRQLLQDTKAVCVFREPQFDDKLARTVTEGFDVKNGTLDPLGMDFPAGEALYFQMMRAIADDLRDCLL